MNTVIYYPFINPRPEWLKLAALCWDKVYRLTPSGEQPSDPDVIKELDEALGGILETVPVRDVVDLDSVLDQFVPWLDAREKRLKELRWEPYSPSTTSGEDVVLEMPFGVPLATTKFKWDLVIALKERGLAVERKIEGEHQIPEWDRDFYLWSQLGEGELVRKPASPGSAQAEYNLSRAEASRLQDQARDTTSSQRAKALQEKARKLKQKAEEIRQRSLVTVPVQVPVTYLPKDVALHYLSLCASQAAKEGKRDLVADGEKFTDAIFYEHSVSSEVATESLKAYLPKDLSSLKPERIAEFREKFAAQRLAYQTAVQSIVDEHAKVASEGELQSLKRSIVELAKQRVDDTQRTYRRANQEMVVKAFGVSLTPPAIATTVASALGIGIFAPAGIAAALAILGTKLLIDREKAKSERSKSPWSYVLDSALIR